MKLITIGLLLLILPFLIIAQKSPIHKKESETIINLQKKNLQIENLIASNTKVVTELKAEADSLKTKVVLIDKKITNLQKQTKNDNFIKLFLYLLTVISAFLLASFGLTEKIEEFYFDGIEKITQYYEIEPNLKNNKNLFVTIVGLIVTITITIIQAFLDGNSSLFISLYISILAFVIYSILKTTNTIQEQSYLDKLKIAYRGILRKFYWKFSKNYCEVCLKKCPNEKKQIIYLLQKEIDQIEIVRFGHDSCISPCFSYYKGSNGAYSPYQITELNLTDLKIKLDSFNKYSEPVKIKLKILSKNII